MDGLGRWVGRALTYHVMDAAVCSDELREQSRALGYVPLIDHKPRGGVKREFAPHEVRSDKTRTVRTKTRAVSERINARLKNEFGRTPSGRAAQSRR